jgi:hypothetical protein
LSVRWLIGVALIVVALMVAACGSSTTPEPSGQPTPASSAAAPAPAGSCPLAVAQLGAFTSGLAADLTNLQGPIGQKPFNATDAAVANFRVSATLTPFKDDRMVANLEGCPTTADLGPRVAKVMATAEAAIEKAQAASITNATSQRAAGLSLLGLLPEVLALSDANDIAASTLGLPHEAAVLPNGSATSGGSAQPGEHPTRTPPLTGPGSSPAAADTWTDAANGYLNDTFATYRNVITWGAALGGSGDPASSTPDELVEGIRQSLGGHLVYMESHRARSCYASAYATDRNLAGQWSALLQGGTLPSDTTPEGQAAARAFGAAQARTTDFLTKMGSFFTTCR